MEKKVFEVLNRSSGTVAYYIPDLDITRSFEPGEVKRISFEELEKLSYQEGGPYLIQNYLFIKDAAATEELNVKTEPEYYYTANEVKELLSNGTLDQLSDCLNFAPNGVIDLVKALSVSMPLNDIAKCNLIEEKLGFNVLKAIENSKDAELEAKPEVKTRKAAPITTPGRKTAPPIVNNSK